MGVNGFDGLLETGFQGFRGVMAQAYGRREGISTMDGHGSGWFAPLWDGLYKYGNDRLGCWVVSNLRLDVRPSRRETVDLRKYGRAQRGQTHSTCAAEQLLLLPQP